MSKFLKEYKLNFFLLRSDLRSCFEDLFLGEDALLALVLFIVEYVGVRYWIRN
jgi:hypothetical protein